MIFNCVYKKNNLSCKKEKHKNVSETRKLCAFKESSLEMYPCHDKVTVDFPNILEFTTFPRPNQPNRKIIVKKRKEKLL